MRKIELNGVYGSGRFTKVSDTDFDFLNQWNWFVTAGGYAFHAKGGKMIYLHRLLIGKPGVFVDHINRDKLDNRRKNLRLAYGSISALNRGINKNNHCGLQGVTYFKGGNRTRRWLARLKLNYKTHIIGYYATKEEASCAYIEYKEKIMKELLR